MREIQFLVAHRTVLLILLATLIGAEDAEDEAAFAEFEDEGTDAADPDGEQAEQSAVGGTTTTTTYSRLRRDELPEDGFVWPTTDEEHFADQLSDEHRCNGCKGVAFQIDKALMELMPKDSKRALLEHEYTEAMECRTKIYDDYGLKKLADKTRVLVGPGLEHTKDDGSVFGGAKWPPRMARFCGSLIGDLGEEETYKLWVEHGSEGFSKALCSASCGGPKRAKAKEEDDDDDEPVKKKRRRKKSTPKEQPKMPEGPPEVVKVYERKELQKMSKKNKFTFLLFCAPSFARCVDLELQWELAARAAKKTDDLKQVVFALANTDSVGTLEFQLQDDILPAFLLFRKGYAAPKGISTTEMLRLREVGDFLNFMQLELASYMQDDPDTFPRGKLEL